MFHLNKIKMNLALYKVDELTAEEIIETEGGILPFIIIGAVLLLSSCGNQANNNGGHKNKQINIQCTNCVIHQHNDTVKVYHK